MDGQPDTRTRSIRADSEAWEVLEWWASVLDIPLGSLLRQAVEETADAIVEAFAEEIDETLPPTVLLLRVRHRLEVPPGPRRVALPRNTHPTADPPG